MTKAKPLSNVAKLIWSNAELRLRLEEAEETLRAIRAGEVEGLLTDPNAGPPDEVKTPYRRLIEAMKAGPVPLLEDGTVVIAVLIPRDGKSGITAIFERSRHGQRIRDCATIRLQKGLTFSLSPPKSGQSQQAHDSP